MRATTQYSSQYLDTYQAHSTPVYAAQWNSFMTDLFITCAFEFTVKIWHADCKLPVWRSVDRPPAPVPVSGVIHRVHLIV